MGRLIRLLVFLLLVALLFPLDGTAGKFRPVGHSWFMGSTDSAIQTTAQTRYYVINGPESGDQNATEALRQTVAGVSGKMSRLYVFLSGDVGNTGSTLVVTVRKNGAASALTCTITGTTAGTETACSDLANQVVVAPTDLISLEFVTTGTPSAVLPRWRVRFDPDVPNQVPVATATTINLVSNADRYYGPGAAPQGTTEGASKVVMPTGAWVRALYVSGVSLAAGNRTVDVLKNGVVQTEFQCIVTTGNSTCSDLSGSLHYAPGDTFSFHTFSGDVATLGAFAATVRLEMDAPGEFPIFEASTPGTGAVNYSALPSGPSAVATATEATAQTYMPALTWLRMYVSAVTAPGANASWLIGLSKPLLASTLRCQIADPATTCSSAEMQANEQDEPVTVISTPSSTAPASGRVQASFAVRPR